MSIFTKGERDQIRDVIVRCQGMTSVDGDDMMKALNTIDAMERTIKGIESATSMQQVETVLIAARAFGIIEEEAE